VKNNIDLDPASLWKGAGNEQMYRDSSTPKVQQAQ
jgi:hypothetical protein